MLHEHTKIKESKIDKKIVIAIGLTLSFALIEFITGHITGSLALIADAGHMILDAQSIFALLIASIITNKLQATKSFTYGGGKVDVIAALFNIALVSIVIFHIISASFSRLDDDFTVQPLGIIIVGTIGLFVNIYVMRLLGELDSIGATSAKLHVLADILGSLAAIASGVIILFTGAIWVDIALSFLIAIFLAHSTYKQSKTCFAIILDAVPSHIDPEEVKQKIRSVEGIVSVHDIHIWRSGNDEISFTAHVDLENFDGWDDKLILINRMLKKLYQINHTTIQPELNFILDESSEFH